MSLKVRYHWTTPLREALVKSVEKRETLWKKYPVVSHDIEMRAKLWGEVADELMEQFNILIDTEDMKKTWKNLKDNYWRITKTFESEPERAKKWKFYEIMRFMERATTDDQADSRSNDDGPSSSNSKSESTSSIEIDDIESRIKDVDSPSSSQISISKDMPLQIVGRSGNSIRGSRKKGSGASTSSQHFVQVSIPEIDQLIGTKQRPPFGTKIQCMAVDFTKGWPFQDNLASELASVWRQLDEKAQDKQKLDRTTEAVLNEKEKAAQFVRNVMSEISHPEEKLCTVTSNTRFLVLVKMARFNYPLSADARVVIVDCATRLRGIYHQGAFALFIKQKMPEGQLHKLLDAFDDFVYNNKPRDPVISEVIEACDPSVHTAFVALFALLEKHRDYLPLCCPDNKWAKMDKDMKDNLNYYFERKRKKTEEKKDKSSVETREMLREKISACTAKVNSTLDLLEKVDDPATKQELTEKLEKTYGILEKITKEQQLLEAERRKLQKNNQKNKSPPKKKKKTAETAVDPEEVCPPIAATALLEGLGEEARSTEDELFDSTVKMEPR